MKEARQSRLPHNILYVVGESKLANPLVNLAVVSYTEQWSALAPAEVQMKGGKTIMLIFNDEQRLRAGIKSLSKRCPYCSKALAAYPLILSDDAGLFVYHAACAAALATEILVDLYTFFRPPEPYHQIFVLDPIRAAPKQSAGHERKELTHAMVNRYPPD
jgi:hypothetical protein